MELERCCACARGSSEDEDPGRDCCWSWVEGLSEEDDSGRFPSWDIGTSEDMDPRREFGACG